jgi:hypothetical protein
MNKSIVSGALFLVLSVTAASTASADANCEDVDIELTNQFVQNGDNKDIRVTDLQYFDAEDGKWRNEVTSNARIGFGDAHTYTRDLERVGGETGVRIKVFFQYNLGGTAWSDTFTATSQAFTCVDGMTVAFDID